ncbi:MAG: hypothetical protein FWF23_05155, partial [Alphaproteobacteria bacterium]|nr:hypothetical protein [Alphaproteobacteria bacterium]
SGARYNTAPVANLATLPPITLPPDPLVTDPDLPPYDSEYTSLGVNPFAYVTRKATIDENYVLDYGITSNDPVFQKIIQGLRFMQAAGNATNETDYRANLDVAVSLLRSSALELQKLHTTVIGNDYLANSQKTSQINIMTNLTNQLASIQQVDKTEVAVRIQDMTANIQASYSVTGSLLKLSILNYL